MLFTSHITTQQLHQCSVSSPLSYFQRRRDLIIFIVTMLAVVVIVRRRNCHDGLFRLSPGPSCQQQFDHIHMTSRTGHDQGLFLTVIRHIHICLFLQKIIDDVEIACFALRIRECDSVTSSYVFELAREGGSGFWFNDFAFFRFLSKFCCAGASIAGCGSTGTCPVDGEE